MKRTVISKFLRFGIFFILTMFLSCHDDYLGQELHTEKLNKVGKAFMDHLLSNPDGEQQWKKLIRLGDIPPNEVALVFQGSSGWQYVLPLLKDSMLMGMVIFPIEIDENSKYLSEGVIVSPLVTDKEGFKSNFSVQGILKSSVSKKWKEKGIIIDEGLIANQSDLTLFAPLSRGAGGVFPAYYTLVIHNYLDSFGNAVINGMNISSFEEIAREVVSNVPGHVEMELMIEDDVIFVIAPHEEVAIYYYDLLGTRLRDRHHCEISFEFLWITGTPGGTGGSSGGSTEGSTGSEPDSPEPPIGGENPVPDKIVVNLRSSSLSGQVEIGDIYYLTLNIYNTNPRAHIPNVINVEYFVRRLTTGQGGSLGETSEMIYTRKAISAGTFEFIAVVRFEGQTGRITSNTVTVTEMCPSISKFKDLPVVQNRAIELWNETVHYSQQHKSTHETSEFGCFIYLNTGTGEYHCGSTIPGNPVQLTGPAKGTVHFVYTTQNFDPRETFDLIVGTIHSHYPLTWAVSGLRREPGPSPDDNAAGLPGIVYDYSQPISAGDSVKMPDNPMQMYIYGPNRRIIP